MLDEGQCWTLLYYGFVGYDMNLYCSGDIVDHIVLLDHIYICVFFANAGNK